MGVLDQKVPIRGYVGMRDGRATAAGAGAGAGAGAAGAAGAAAAAAGAVRVRRNAGSNCRPNLNGGQPLHRVKDRQGRCNPEPKYNATQTRLIPMMADG